MRQIAISDIHGCARTFQALLDKIQLSTNDQLYLLGDYVDRGPDSKGVIDTILGLIDAGYQVQTLMGNHEKMLLDATDNEKMGIKWMFNGGQSTLDSYSKDGELGIPDSHLSFLNTLSYYHESEPYIFVHAGLNMTIDNPYDDLFEMLWIRDWYHKINKEWLGDRIIVHGHTPTPVFTIKNTLKRLNKLPVINIDAGCFIDRPEFGHLCAVDLSNKEFIFQENIDRS